MKHLVNTGVADPEHRKLNRKIGRHKTKKLKQSEKALEDPQDFVALSSERYHSKKIEKLKMNRDELQSNHDSTKG